MHQYLDDSNNTINDIDTNYQRKKKQSSIVLKKYYSSVFSSISHRTSTLQLFLVWYTCFLKAIHGTFS